MFVQAWLLGATAVFGAIRTQNFSFSCFANVILKDTSVPTEHECASLYCREGHTQERQARLSHLRTLGVGSIDPPLRLEKVSEQFPEQQTKGWMGGKGLTSIIKTCSAKLADSPEVTHRAFIDEAEPFLLSRFY